MGNTQIMVVEDEALIAMALQKKLKKWGYEVPAVVSSGEEAIIAATKFHLDLVLMDIRLYGRLDGVETAQEITKYISIPVIYLTGFSDEHILKRAEDTEAFGYLMKPINERELQATLQIALHKAKLECELKESLILQSTLSHQLQHTSAKLQESNKQLKLANQRMYDLVIRVSHDLRTPLSNINGFAELLKKTTDEDERQFFSDRIHDISLHSMTMVHELLEIFCLDRGELQINLQSCDLYLLAQEVMQGFQALSDKKEIQLINEIQESIYIKADRERLLEVLNNLISNAIKFTPHFGEVTLQNTPHQKGLLIEVIDTGVGISEEDLPKLFNEYKKFSTLGTEHEEGFGWGLPLSQELIRAHDSQIEVSSILGQGSRFSFILPYGEK